MKPRNHTHRGVRVPVPIPFASAQQHVYRACGHCASAMLSDANSRLCAGTHQPKGVSSTWPNPICQRTAARVQGMRALCICYVE